MRAHPNWTQIFIAYLLLESPSVFSYGFDPNCPIHALNQARLEVQDDSDLGRYWQLDPSLSKFWDMSNPSRASNRLCGPVAVANVLVKFRKIMGFKIKNTGIKTDVGQVLDSIENIGVGKKHVIQNGLLMHEISDTVIETMRESGLSVETKILAASEKMLITPNIPENSAVSRFTISRLKKNDSNRGVVFGFQPSDFIYDLKDSKITSIIVNIGRWGESDWKERSDSNKVGAHYVILARALFQPDGKIRATFMDPYENNPEMPALLEPLPSTPDYLNGSYGVVFDHNPDPGMKHMVLGLLKIRLNSVP